MDDPFEDEAPKRAQPPPKKRSFFSTAAIAKSTAPDEPVEFFSRAKELHPQILAEEERRRQKRLLKMERKRSSTSVETKEMTPPEEKRRRISAQGKDNDGYSSNESGNHDMENSRTRRKSSHSSPGSRRSLQGSETHNVQGSPTSLSARYNKEIHAQNAQLPKPRASAGCITLSDSEDETPRMALPVRKPANQSINLVDSDDEIYQPARPTTEDENQFSDEEYPELVAAAKERARLKAEQAAKSSKAFGAQNRTANNATLELDDIFETGSGSANIDPTIEILITSVMADTNPLRVKRRISQNLAEVRLAWCDRQSMNGQPMGSEFKDIVFLTWKNIRLFDYSTCSGLGLKVDPLGNLISTGDGIDSDGRVHLEAWTPDAFNVYQKRQAAKKNKEQGLDDGNEAEEERQPPIKKTKIVLKSKNLPDYKLLVKPVTTVERMADAFREANNISEEKTITLYFDGDKLDPSDAVEDTELGDMDTVEVHIR